MKGKLRGGKWADESDGIIENKGSNIIPRSLYLQQLEERLGPQTVEKVTIPQQRQSQIWGLLKAWRGEKRLSDNL